MIRLPDPAASALVTVYTRPVACGLAPLPDGCDWGCGEGLDTVLLSTGQSLMKWPTWPHLWHALLSESWGQALLRWAPLQWKHYGLEGWDCWGWCENLLGPCGWGLEYGFLLSSCLLMDPDGPPTFSWDLWWASTSSLSFSITFAFYTKAGNSLIESGATMSLRSPLNPFSNFLHYQSSAIFRVWNLPKCLNFSTYSNTDISPCVSCKNSNSFAYLTLFGKNSA